MYIPLVILCPSTECQLQYSATEKVCVQNMESVLESHLNVASFKRGMRILTLQLSTAIAQYR
jgi:hypothetical protein